MIPPFVHKKGGEFVSYIIVTISLTLVTIVVAIIWDKHLKGHSGISWSSLSRLKRSFNIC
jgi:hypothetical protein